MKQEHTLECSQRLVDTSEQAGDWGERGLQGGPTEGRFARV